MPREQRGWPFRIGTPMWDGFDDSSTFMSREVALAFAQVTITQYRNILSAIYKSMRLHAYLASFDSNIFMV
jgi:hypothetical protein